MAFPAQVFEGLALTDNIKEAFCAISDIEFQRFFMSLKAQQLLKVETTKTPEELTDIRAKVMMVSEIEGIFLGIRSEAKRRREQR